MKDMATVPKPKPSPQAKRTARAAPKPPVPSSAPFLRFCHSEALRKKTLAVLEALEHADDPAEHRAALADIVVELMKSGFDYFFMKPLKLSKAGFIVEQSANLGLAGAQQVIGSVIRNIIGRMNGPQLLSVCGSIRDLMR